jgi:hypothetical protein
MKTERPSNATERSARADEEKLEAINAGVRNRSKALELIRHTMEDMIEAKAKRRRDREAPATSGWKKAA